MSLFLAGFVVVVFAAVIERLELSRHAGEVGSRTSNCLQVLRDPTLDNSQKELALQRHSLRLFRLLGILVAGSLLALGLPLILVWLLGQIGLGSIEGVLAILGRLDFLVVATVIGSIVYLLVRRLRQS